MRYDGMKVYDCDVNENDWLDIKFSNEEKIDGETKKLVNSEGKNQKIKKMLDKAAGIFKSKPKPDKEQSSGIEADETGSDAENETYQRPFVKEIATERAQKPQVPQALQGVRKYAKAIAVVLVIALLLTAMRFIDSGFAGDVFSYAKTTYTSVVSKSSTEHLFVLSSSAEITVEDGDIVFSGGSIVSCIEDGTVFSVTEDSVTVKVNDRLFITYSGLSEILVQEGDVVSKYGALGRYRETAIVNLIVDGEKITSVSLKDFVLIWSV